MQSVFNTVEQEETPSEGWKRRRPKLTTACNECRRRKTKCNGENPCSSCIKSRATCSYATPTELNDVCSREVLEQINERLKVMENLLIRLVNSEPAHAETARIGEPQDRYMTDNYRANRLKRPYRDTHPDEGYQGSDVSHSGSRNSYADNHAGQPYNPNLHRSWVKRSTYDMTYTSKSVTRDQLESTKSFNQDIPKLPPAPLYDALLEVCKPLLRITFPALDIPFIHDTLLQWGKKPADPLLPLPIPPFLLFALFTVASPFSPLPIEIKSPPSAGDCNTNFLWHAVVGLYDQNRSFPRCSSICASVLMTYYTSVPITKASEGHTDRFMDTAISMAREIGLSSVFAGAHIEGLARSESITIQGMHVEALSKMLFGFDVLEHALNGRPHRFAAQCVALASHTGHRGKDAYFRNVVTLADRFQKAASMLYKIQEHGRAIHARMAEVPATPTVVAFEDDCAGLTSLDHNLTELYYSFGITSTNTFGTAFDATPEERPLLSILVYVSTFVLHQSFLIRQFVARPYSETLQSRAMSQHLDNSLAILSRSMPVLEDYIAGLFDEMFAMKTPDMNHKGKGKVSDARSEQNGKSDHANYGLNLQFKFILLGLYSVLKTHLIQMILYNPNQPFPRGPLTKTRDLFKEVQRHFPAESEDVSQTIQTLSRAVDMIDHMLHRLTVEMAEPVERDPYNEQSMSPRHQPYERSKPPSPGPTQLSPMGEPDKSASTPVRARSASSEIPTQRASGQLGLPSISSLLNAEEHEPSPSRAISEVRSEREYANLPPTGASKAFAPSPPYTSASLTRPRQPSATSSWISRPSFPAPLPRRTDVTTPRTIALDAIRNYPISGLWDLTVTIPPY